MDKTIRELAEEYGMTKQAMQYHIKKLPERCKNFATQKGVKILMINQEGQEILRFLLAKKQMEEVTKFGNKEIENFATKEEVLELKHKLEMKDRKSTRLNSSHVSISYAVFCLKKKNKKKHKYE